MEDAVYRMTGMPAHKFGLADRGVLRAGAYADLVIFDPAAVIDTGTYSDPKRYPAYPARLRQRRRRGRKRPAYEYPSRPRAPPHINAERIRVTVPIS